MRISPFWSLHHWSWWCTLALKFPQINARHTLSLYIENLRTLIRLYWIDLQRGRTAHWCIASQEGHRRVETWPTLVLRTLLFHHEILAPFHVFYSSTPPSPVPSYQSPHSIVAWWRVWDVDGCFFITRCSLHHITSSHTCICYESDIRV